VVARRRFAPARITPAARADWGHQTRLLLGLGDGSYCNRIVFRAAWDRVALVCRCRKDLRLCFRHEGKGRFYAEKTFTPEEIYADTSIPWREARIHHGGKRRVARYKEVRGVLWRGGAGRQSLRLLVVAPTPYRKLKHGRTDHRPRAFRLTTDETTPAKQLLQPMHLKIDTGMRCDGCADHDQPSG